MSKTPDMRYSRDISEVISQRTKPVLQPETGWHKIGISEDIGIAFQDSWANVGTTGSPPASFYLSNDGEVRNRGKVDGGIEGSTIFTFPEECRPEYSETFICAVDAGGKANITVNPDGTVVVDSITS